MIKKILFLILFSVIIPNIVFACEGREIKKSGLLSLYNGGCSILGLSAVSSTIWFSFFIN